MPQNVSGCQKAWKSTLSSHRVVVGIEIRWQQLPWPGEISALEAPGSTSLPWLSVGWTVSTTHCICSAAQIRGWVWTGTTAHHGNMYVGWKLRVCIPGFWRLLVICLFLRQNLSVYYKLIWSLSCQFWDYRSATLWPPGKLFFTLFSKGMPFSSTSVAFIATRYVVTLSIKCTKGKSVRNKVD